MFEEFESKMKLIKNNYDVYKELPNKFNKNLFNKIKQETTNEISKITKTSSIEDIKLLKEIYLYQFLNPEHCEKKITNIIEMTDFIINTLKKFQWIVGGYLIEDINWLIESGNSKRFKINKNDVILTNTLNYYDDETETFMENLIKYINNFVDKTSLTIQFKIKEDELLDLKFAVIFIRKLN